MAKKNFSQKKPPLLKSKKRQKEQRDIPVKKVNFDRMVAFEVDDGDIDICL